MKKIETCTSKGPQRKTQPETQRQIVQNQRRHAVVIKGDAKIRGHWKIDIVNHPHIGKTTSFELLNYTLERS